MNAGEEYLKKITFKAEISGNIKDLVMQMNLAN